MSASRLKYTATLICVIILGISLALWIQAPSRAHKECDNHARPWYGRGRDLPGLPYSIAVGPVDAKYGIKGVIELGMTKTALHNPWVYRWLPLCPEVKLSKYVNTMIPAM